ncbi:hypothetical protein FA132_22870 [Pseudomonas aeruginosa]|nr:hypothetical protein [Pseudomonas aeruginosa]
MTPEQILKMPASEYMGEAQHEFFRSLLLKQREEALARMDGHKKALAELKPLPDPLDAATVEEERSEIGRSIARENSALRAISSALMAIDEDEYGYCSGTGEEIGLDRLLVHPTALLSVEEQERQERVSAHHLR